MCGALTFFSCVNSHDNIVCWHSILGLKKCSCDKQNSNVTLYVCSNVVAMLTNPTSGPVMPWPNLPDFANGTAKLIVPSSVGISAMAHGITPVPILSLSSRKSGYIEDYC